MFVKKLNKLHPYLIKRWAWDGYNGFKSRRVVEKKFKTPQYFLLKGGHKHLSVSAKLPFTSSYAVEATLEFLYQSGIIT